MSEESDTPMKVEEDASTDLEVTDEEAAEQVKGGNVNVHKGSEAEVIARDFVNSANPSK